LTVRRHLACVRAAYRYSVRYDLVERDPTADVRLLDIEPATYGGIQLRAIVQYLVQGRVQRDEPELAAPCR
jgi:hypothetical protein